MRRFLTLGWLLFSLATLGADAVDSLAAVDQALALELPGVAISHATQAIATSEPGPRSRALKQRLLEACVRDGRYEEALRWSEDAELAGDLSLPYWKGLALLESGHGEKAVALLNRAAGDRTAPHATLAALSLARYFDRTGNVDSALIVLRPWLRSTAPEANGRARHLAVQIALNHGLLDRAETLLEDPFPAGLALDPPPALLAARLAVAQDRFADAIRRFRALSRPDSGYNESIRQQSYLGEAEVWTRLDAYGNARVALAAVIDGFPGSPYVAKAFDLLYRLPDFPDVAASSQWETWRRGESPNVRIRALYYGGLARWLAGERDQALQDLTKIRPGDPLYAESRLRLAEWHLERGALEECLQRIHALRSLLAPESPLLPEVDALEAAALYQSEAFAPAASLYRKIAESPTGPNATSVPAWFNAAMAAFRAGDTSGFGQALGSLRMLAQSDGQVVNADARQAHGDALLEKGLALASQEEKQGEAATTLRSFLQEHPDHAGVIRAHLRLAEISLYQDPPGFDEATEIIERIRSSDKTTQAEREQVDYLEIRMAALRDLPDRVIQLTEAFLKNHPKPAALRPDVRLKRAEAFFRKQNFANAGSELDLLIGETPDSPLEANAQFLRAAAALNTGNPERAINFWGELVANASDEMKLLARHQQAVALCQLGRRDFALAQFNAVLDAKPTGELLFQTLMAKGECLMVMGEKEKPLEEEAIEVFEQIIAQPEVTPFWRDQAYYRKGIVHELNKEYNEALGAFQIVLGFPLENGRPSSHWYYRAGFEAISILELRKNWATAAQIATDMANTAGPRAEEARKKAEALKTEHFLFQE